MDGFIINKVNSEGYDRFVLCLTFESIATYKSLVELSPLIRHQTGRLLIDQLLVTGNGQNRFISCRYTNGILDFATARTVWLNAHYDNVENSILTENQRYCIMKGLPF